MGQGTIPTPEQEDVAEATTPESGTQSPAQGETSSGEATLPPLEDRYRGAVQGLNEKSRALQQKEHELAVERQQNQALQAQMSRMSQPAAYQQPQQQAPPPQQQWDPTTLMTAEDEAGLAEAEEKYDMKGAARVNARVAQRAAAQQSANLAKALGTYQSYRGMTDEVSQAPELRDPQVANWIGQRAQAILQEQSPKIARTGVLQLDGSAAIERAVLEYRAAVGQRAPMEQARTQAAAEGYVDMGGTGGPSTAMPDEQGIAFDPILHLTASERFLAESAMKKGLFSGVKTREGAYNKYWKSKDPAVRKRRLRDGAPADGASEGGGVRKKVLYRQGT